MMGKANVLSVMIVDREEGGSTLAEVSRASGV